MTLRILITTAAVALGLAMAHPAYAQDQAAAKGPAVYAAKNCGLCHSIAGKGNTKGPLDGVGTKLTADEIRAWIVTPKEMTAKTKAARQPAMPVTAKLSKDEIDALVAYLGSLKSK